MSDRIIEQFEKESLEYHKSTKQFDTNGKTGTLLTKQCNTTKELSFAYSPGVAYPCLEIQKDKLKAYTYTNKGNLVAVISDGTAVLGLGDIGHEASKPVMEGKCVLFKKFANVDAIDIELNVHSVDEIVNTIYAMSDSFGGINLEDIAAPKCFEIEKTLQEKCNIPIFHDDQHGTAVITTAGLINILELYNKKANELKVVVVGAGASGIACATMYKSLGIQNIIMIDSKGVIHDKRDDLNKYKQKFAINTDDRTLQDAIKNADMVLGLSTANIITKQMVQSMNTNPIIFACANPNPEITPTLAKQAREDVIIGTGRSDYANQVNNVLGFPAIFRGALDVKATKITENMKLSAAKALATLARQEVPTYVKKAHNRENMSFGSEYIIPSPFDKRVLVYVASAVAKTAVEDKVAKMQEFDIEKYKQYLTKMIEII
jgi:malate dehydrogenase (oxaloacetate-decarboxylating)(NADP+)